jgi:hypothetical protein
MTKIQIPFTLSAPLDEQAMTRIANVYSTYGILGIKAAPGDEKLTVEYDATRLSPRDVERCLASAGVPLAQRSV